MIQSGDPINLRRRSNIQITILILIAEQHRSHERSVKDEQELASETRSMSHKLWQPELKGTVDIYLTQLKHRNSEEKEWKLHGNGKGQDCITVPVDSLCSS
jgi:hypothetical protein